MDKELVRGSLDILMLSLLKHRDMYGYEIVKELKEQSNELYNMSEGTLYPALKRLENKKWLHSYWTETLNGRRKYYSITEDGEQALQLKLNDWNSVHSLIHKTSGGFK